MVSKISNIGHVLKYCIGIVSDLNFQYRPSLILTAYNNNIIILYVVYVGIATNIPTLKRNFE